MVPFADGREGYTFWINFDKLAANAIILIKILLHETSEFQQRSFFTVIYIDSQLPSILISVIIKLWQG